MEEQREDFEGTSNQRNWIPENFVASSLSSFTLIGHHYSEAKDTKINTTITISTKIWWVWWDEHWESQPCRHRWSSRSFSPLEQVVRGKRYIIQDISYQLASHISSQQTFLCNYQWNNALPKTNLCLCSDSVGSQFPHRTHRRLIVLLQQDPVGKCIDQHCNALFAWHVCLCSWFGQ